MAIHTQSKKCPVYKRRKRQEKLRAKSKGNPYGPCGGSAQYQIEIALTAVGNLASVKCTECGEENYISSKNKKNNPDRIEHKKYCPKCKKVTLHKEKK